MDLELKDCEAEISDVEEPVAVHLLWWELGV